MGVFGYRDLTFQGFLAASASAAIATAVIMLTLAFTQIFGAIAVLAGLGRMISDTLLSPSQNPIVLFMIIAITLLILAPILFPLMTSLGVDPVHLGLVTVFNPVLGMVTPPVGINPFVMARICGVSIIDVFRGGLPYFVALYTALILLTYVPQITLFLPTLLLAKTITNKEDYP
jgi:TRAP-type C4-dicarboxylate transport system permease large subunit